ncbi:MAG: hypothetical protein IPJ85_12295 [Flavobacteriales bacterium]|nr:hypothetical protein [Flavobacteriales bacterium]
MKARVSVILSLVAFCTLPSAAQKVKLSKALSGVIDTAWMPVTRHANIFEKHAWLQPDIKSIPFSMTDGEAQLEVGGNVLTVSGGRDGLSISVAGESRTAAPRTCTNCYPDKSVLRMKAVVTSMWVPVTTYVMQSHMVARSRPVTRYQYNASTRTTQAVHSTETYYTTEFRHVPRTTYRYQSRTTYVLDIPKSTVFEFGGLVQPTDQYLVYAPNDDSDLWHLQQTSFLIATSSDGIHYVMIDSDADGDFTGKRDQVAFNTWNPYDEGSRYRAMRRFSSNRWYSHEELAQESFIELDLSDDGQHAIGRDLNHGYYGKKEFGTLSIVGLPQDGEVVINGERFPARKLSKPLRCQFGYYNVHLEAPWPS